MLITVVTVITAATSRCTRWLNFQAVAAKATRNGCRSVAFRRNRANTGHEIVAKIVANIVAVGRYRRFLADTVSVSTH